VPTSAIDELLAGLQREPVRTAPVGDVLDQLGRRRQFLPAGITPLAPEMVLCGRAMPVLLADADPDEDGPAYGRLTEALDQLKPGEVYFASGLSVPCASWGELMTARARARGAAGAIVDSFHRDSEQVLAQDWPVFSRGAYAQDAAYRSTVVAFRVTLEIEGIVVSPGDLVLGDRDGIVVVPRELEEEVLRRAREKLRTEDVVRRALDGGMSIGDAFKAYGVI